VLRPQRPRLQGLMASGSDLQVFTFRTTASLHKLFSALYMFFDI
ncbi:hypothetical protein A2U01_0057496, partial [Trifolium medium]|nr:hypothetical protein [Trifolium medium]